MGLVKPRYRFIDNPPGHATTKSSGGKTVNIVASVTVVKVPWWKWWRK